MDTPNVKATHIGKKIERIREIRGMKQETLALKMGISQQSISRIEQSENIEDEKLQQVAKALEVPADVIRNFDEESYFNNFNSNNTFNDSSSLNNNYHCTFNPIDKLMDVVEQNRKLYELLLKEKDTIIEMYKKQQKAS